ncbi:sigma-like protein [Streptomyces sp. T028]|uniref:sigma-like protein n=1 Tax=Streptomyces sp. T028 TaxID=3394379 RepID=UPI003A860785
MSQAEENDVIKPLDNHASVVEEGVLATAVAEETAVAAEETSGDEITTMDNHASGGAANLLDNHASGETA